MCFENLKPLIPISLAQYDLSCNRDRNVRSESSLRKKHEVVLLLEDFPEIFEAAVKNTTAKNGKMEAFERAI